MELAQAITINNQLIPLYKVLHGLRAENRLAEQCVDNPHKYDFEKNKEYTRQDKEQIENLIQLTLTEIHTFPKIPSKLAYEIKLMESK